MHRAALCVLLCVVVYVETRHNTTHDKSSTASVHHRHVEDFITNTAAGTGKRHPKSAEQSRRLIDSLRRQLLTDNYDYLDSENKHDVDLNNTRRNNDEEEDYDSQDDYHRQQEQYHRQNYPQQHKHDGNQRQHENTDYKQQHRHPLQPKHDNYQRQAENGDYQQQPEQHHRHPQQPGHDNYQRQAENGDYQQQPELHHRQPQQPGHHNYQQQPEEHYRHNYPPHQQNQHRRFYRKQQEQHDKDDNEQQHDTLTVHDMPEPNMETYRPGELVHKLVNKNDPHLDDNTRTTQNNTTANYGQYDTVGNGSALSDDWPNLRQHETLQDNITSTTVKYKIHMIERGSGRRSMFVEEVGGGGVSLTSLDRAPLPPYLLPRRRRQYMRQARPKHTKHSRKLFDTWLENRRLNQ